MCWIRKLRRFPSEVRTETAEVATSVKSSAWPSNDDKPLDVRKDIPSDQLGGEAVDDYELVEVAQDGVSDERRRRQAIELSDGFEPLHPSPGRIAHRRVEVLAERETRAMG